MSDILIRKQGRAGRITFNRPTALNALSHAMCLEIETALDQWRNDDEIALIVIDADGDRAFCAGGDIVELYDTGKAGNVVYGQKFWRDEYRMNVKMFEFPKPVASFMQGFTMGGGVGAGCHASHRVVGDTSKISMPEVAIGLVPDVGGSLILSRAPGRLGEYLGTTAGRMGAADAIYAGFADYYIPEALWPNLIDQLCATADHTLIDAAAQQAPGGQLETLRPQIDAHFAGETLGDIVRSLRHDPSEFSQDTQKSLSRNAPLSMACAVEMTHRLRGNADIRQAVALEYRFTHRAIEHADLLEGIRAQVIDKDRSPNWKHSDIATVPRLDVVNMLKPLQDIALNFEKEDA
ncbi:enoyl-CoA hydratase/isomerase family protein [Cochlodiniinecator piscidefendens]|uniref:enoyl-CoA hydratase/isomerase family protein n=1 Tax=Cochlodiniinecator piscidefendens TaxID=2715756 RepID=UPI00140E263A|nr:enoyl-CoA hydratase/isomerase family protein [Cochlodiniinecator piscidefendens]